MSDNQLDYLARRIALYLLINRDEGYWEKQGLPMSVEELPPDLRRRLYGEAKP